MYLLRILYRAFVQFDGMIANVPDEVAEIRVSRFVYDKIQHCFVID